MDLKNKVVLVTGGASGIGKALCQRFHQEGARGIGVADLDFEGAQDVASTVDGLALRTDVSREADIRAAVRATEERFGPVDVLCSNAGVGFTDAPGWMAASQTNAQWDKIWKINLMSHVWGARAVLPGMIGRGSGYLLNTSSAAGLLSQIGDAAYSATKHAAIGFAESLAITHYEQGIRVSVLCPQAIDTPLLEAEGDRARALAAAKFDGVRTVEELADVTVEAMANETFLILVHPETRKHMQHKVADYDRWLGGMRRLRRTLFEDDSLMDVRVPDLEE